MDNRTDRLNYPQSETLKKRFSYYFPYISTRNCPIEIFERYLRFADEQPLTLPKHLRDDDESLEVDFPAMLSEQPTLSLIDKVYLEELQEKIRNEKGFKNIFKHIREKDEARFAAGYEEQYAPCISSEEENVYKLFKEKVFSDRNINHLPKYDTESNRFAFDFFGSFSRRTPDNIYDAYRPFYHKVYNLRAFEMWRKKNEETYKAPVDYKYNTLHKRLMIYLKADREPFYDKILYLYTSYLEKHGVILSKSKEDEIKYTVMSAFPLMVDNELETTTRGTTIYSPTVPEKLIDRIQQQSTVSRLTIMYGSSSNFPESWKIKIRKIFDEICLPNNIESKLLSEKSRTWLTDASREKRKGRYDKKLEALCELLKDSDSKDFVRKMEQEEILTLPNQAALRKYNVMLGTISLDQPFSTDQENGGNLFDVLEDLNSAYPDESEGDISSEEMNAQKMVFEDKNALEELLQFIHKRTKEEFPTEPENGFAEKVKLEILKFIEKGWDRDSSIVYPMGKLFGEYIRLRNIKDCKEVRQRIFQYMQKQNLTETDDEKFIKTLYEHSLQSNATREPKDKEAIRKLLDHYKTFYDVADGVSFAPVEKHLTIRIQKTIEETKKILGEIESIFNRKIRRIWYETLGMIETLRQKGGRK